MARIRTIKPEFWTSGQVLECSTNVRLLFIGLWNFADDAGRHPWRPKQIKAQVFPADAFTETEIQGMLLELSKNGLITKYVVDEQEYFTINGWHHQRIDKPQEPKYPAPLQEHSKNVPGTIPPDSIGKDRIGRDSTPTTIPDDFALTDDLIAYAAKKGIRNRKVLENYTEQFVLSCQSKKYKYADFKATWKNWLRRDIEEGKIQKDPEITAGDY